MEGTFVRPGVSAWQQMLRAVLDVDERKVEDCKDDIDTLLVFAGLFSAVLTAFLVQSYTILQPDSHHEMTFLLRQSLLKNYTTGTGYINSTSPILEVPPFQAPLWAVRVNALWFASLVCSLATASIAMLVKQWLREYLAIEWTAPQEKLRAWQYRKAAVADWKVFGIASALPLLLQASLALFFLGLCLFTSAIDDRIGQPTMLLVANWAFFLLMTTLAPLASPRCPFKVPPLKGIHELGRQCPMIASALEGFIYVTTRTWMSITNALLSLATAVMSIIRQASYSSRSCIVRLSLTSTAIAFQDFSHRLTKPEFLARFCKWLQRSSSLPFRRAGAPREDQIVKEAKEDIELLLSIDASVVNDALLKPMLDLVDCKNGRREALLPFAAKLLEHRVGVTAKPHPQDNMGLPPPATTTLSPLAQDMIRDVLDRLIAEAVPECVDQTEILLDIDSTMLDDSLLKPMWVLVQRSTPPPTTDALHTFALRILGHRISPAPDFPIPCRLCTATIAMDLTALSAKAFDIVSLLVLQMINTRAAEPGSVEDIASFILSIDHTFQHDSFLLPMLRVLQSKNPPPNTLVSFAIGLAEHRMQDRYHSAASLWETTTFLEDIPERRHVVALSSLPRSVMTATAVELSRLLTLAPSTTIVTAEDSARVLLFIDAVTACDEDLELMWRVVQAKDLAPKSLIMLASRLARHRVLGGPSSPSPCVEYPFDLSHVTQIGWDVICEIVLQAFDTRSARLQCLSSVPPEWARTGLNILNTRSRPPYSPSIAIRIGAHTKPCGVLRHVARLGGSQFTSAYLGMILNDILLCSTSGFTRSPLSFNSSPDPSYHPSSPVPYYKAPGLLWRSLPMRIQRLSPDARYSIATTLHEDLKHWMSNLSCHSAKSKTSICKANITLLVLVDDTTPAEFLQAFATTFANIIDTLYVYMTRQSVRHLFGDLHVGMCQAPRIASKLSLLINAAVDGSCDQVFNAALQLYAVALLGESPNHESPTVSAPLWFWVYGCGLDLTTTTLEQSSDTILTDLWKHLQDIASIDNSLQTPAALELYAHACMHLIPHINLDQSEIEEDSSNLQQNMAPIFHALRDKLYTNDHNIDVDRLAIRAQHTLERIVLPNPWLVDRFSTELLEVILSFIPSTWRRFHYDANTIRLHRYLFGTPLACGSTISLSPSTRESSLVSDEREQEPFITRATSWPELATQYADQ